MPSLLLCDPCFPWLFFDLYLIVLTIAVRVYESPHLLVARLAEVVVPETDGLKRLRCLKAHNFVGNVPQAFAGFLRTNRHCHDNPRRLETP